MLIVFRSFQGLAVAGFGVSAQAIVADVFPPDQRGRAMGLAMIPTLVGPVVGPLLGGVLSQTLGWRRCAGLPTA
jgi:DHA2 family multidrug resistance protein